MALTGFDRAAASGAPPPYRIAVEVYTDTPHKWCDINKPVRAAAGDDFYARLIGLPSLKIRSEVVPGRFATSVSALKLKDDDGAFGRDASNVTLYDLSGNSGTITDWHDKKVKIRIGHHVESATAWTYVTLGTFKIDRIVRDSRTKTATMRLVGLEKELIDASAADIKRGDSWLTNIPIPLLAEEILSAGTNGEGTWEANSPPNDCRQDWTERVLSVVGNMPAENSGGGYNDHTQVAPRYIFRGQSGDRLNEYYFCGYDTETGRPSIVVWDQSVSPETWTVHEIKQFDGTTFGAGWEIVYGVQVESGAYDDDLWFFLVRNESSPADSYTSADQHMVYVRIDPDTSWTTPAFQSLARRLWRCGMVGYQGYWDGSAVLSWGNFPTYGVTNVYNLAVNFSMRVSAPAANAGTTVLFRPCGAANATTGRVEPIILEDVTDSNGITGAVEAEDMQPGHCSGFRSSGAAGRYDVGRVPMSADPSESFKHSEDYERVYWLEWYQPTSTTGWWRLMSIDATSSSGSLRTQIVYFGNTQEGQVHTLFEAQPSAFDLRVDAGGTGVVYIAYMDLEGPRSGLVPSMQTTIVSFTHSTGNLTSPTAKTFANDVMTTNAARKYCPYVVTLRLHHSQNKMWGTACNLFAAGGHCYGLWWHSSSLANAVFINDNPHASGSALPVSTAPFVHHCGARTVGTTGYHFLQDQATGTVWELAWDGTDNFRVNQIISEGGPADGENCWSSTNLFWDGSVLYGVSASGPPADVHCKFLRYGGWDPGDPPLAAETPAGRMSLWWWHTSVGDIVRVADFADRSCWDALEMCRGLAGDYTMGFGRDGAMIFKARPTAGDAVVEVRRRGDQAPVTDGTVVMAEQIKSHVDYDAVANNITLPVWEGERAEPKTTLILTPDSTADGISVTAHQTGTAACRIVLRCIRAGSAQEDDAAEGRPLIFSWSRVYADITGTLTVAAMPGAMRLHVAGIWIDGEGNYRLGDAKLRVGDTVRVGDSDVVSVAEYTTSPSSILLDGGSIGGSGTHAIGSAVTITPKSGSRFADSLDGVCTVATGFVTSSGYATLTVDSTAALSPGMVLFRDTAYVQVAEILSDTEVYVRKQVLGTGKGHPEGGMSWAVDTVLRGAIWFERANHAYAISNTGLSVGISGRAVETYHGPRFREGDRIVVTGSGLQAKKIEHAVFRAVNAASQNKYGKKEYKPRIENRLMTQTRARILLSQLNHLAYPPLMTTCSGLPLLTSINIGDLVDVRDSYLFPDADAAGGYPGDYTVRHSVIGIAWDLNRGTTTLTLRSVYTAGRAGEAAQLVSPPHRVLERYHRYGGTS